ncbi:MAG: flagellar hook-basal body complex protein [Xanthobacteraceae bacterium]
MGIFGALTTAVTGLRAQSFALENISGNIANSQTTAFKRVDTSFLDLIPDNPPAKQLSGTVAASARATNTVQGDFQAASIGTFMAINGDGFFVVQKPSSFTDGRPTFDGSDLYTRRGDFQTDKDGFLVNGAGYYLMGIPVDAKTGNLAGSVPQLLKFQNDFLPAQPTTQVQYRANLAAYPATTAHDTSVPGSELIDPKTFSANPVAGSPAPAQITGFGAVLSGDANALLTGTQVVPAAMTTTGAFTVNGQVVGIVNSMTHAQVLAAINSPTAVNGTGGFTAAGGTVGGAPAGITIAAAGLNGGAPVTVSTIVATDTAAQVATKINTALAGATGGADGISAQVVGGQIVINSALADAVTLAGDSATLTAVGYAAGNRNSTVGTVPPGMLAATFDGSGHLVLESSSADNAIDIASTSPSVLAELGLSVGTIKPTNLLTQSAVAQGQTMDIKVGSNPTLSITFGTGASEVSTMAELLAKLNTLTGGTATLDNTNGNVKIGANSLTDAIQITGTATASNFGIRTLTGLPSNQQVLGLDTTAFISQTIGGGAITAYDQSGSPVNMQLRWGKVDSASLGTGHSDVWNLFYQVDSNATGTQVAWQNAGVNYKFDANGQMNPLIANTTLTDVTVNGISLGTLQIVHGSGGMTQFSDTNGTAQVNLIQQDGFPAGSLQTIAISDKGRVVGTYSNGRTLDLAEVTLANFNGPNQLKRLDGGAFAVTDDSGPAILGAPGKIVGSSLEGSNVDIADEFTKLIVTQQAYSANTRVVTTSNQMVQDVLNMLR